MKRYNYSAILVSLFTIYSIQAMAQVAISADGVIESRNGGFKFPDGSTQTSAPESGLGDLSCTLDQIAKFNGVNWQCSNDANDGNVSTERIKVVSHSCVDIRAILDAINDAAAANPYLVYLEPGIYDCGTTPLTMKPYVSIKGSGQRLTKITGFVDSDGVSTGVVIAANDTELSHLSVTNTFPGEINIALVSLGTNISVSHVAAIATATGPDPEDTYPSPVQANGIRINGGTATLDHVTAMAEGAPMSVAIMVSDGAVSTMEDVTATTITDSAALYLYGSGTTVTAKNSQFSGGAYTAIFVDVDATAYLITSQLKADTFTLEGSGDAICVGSYDRVLVPLLSDCT